MQKKSKGAQGSNEIRKHASPVALIQPTVQFFSNWFPSSEAGKVDGWPDRVKELGSGCDGRASLGLEKAVFLLHSYSSSHAEFMSVTHCLCLHVLPYHAKSLNSIHQ